MAFEGLLDEDLSAVRTISSYGGDMRIEETYSQLRDWVHGSLDKYKVLRKNNIKNALRSIFISRAVLKGELIGVLYPLFIHCYLELVARGQPEEGKDLSLNCHF